MSLWKVMLIVGFGARKRNKVLVHLAHTSFLLLFSTLVHASYQMTLLSEKMEGHLPLWGGR